MLFFGFWALRLEESFNKFTFAAAFFRFDPEDSSTIDFDEEDFFFLHEDAFEG